MQALFRHHSEERHEEQHEEDEVDDPIQIHHNGQLIHVSPSQQVQLPIIAIRVPRQSLFLRL